MKTNNLFLCTIFSFIFISYFSIFAQEADVRKVLESVGDEINRAVLSGDYETVMSHFTDDVIIFPIFQAPIKGKQAYRKAVNKLKEKGVKYQSINGTSTEIWECGNMVYEIGTFGMSLVTKDSSKPTAYYGSYFNIWQKQSDRSYKLKYMISNLDFNPFEK